ncbi:(d)CMP kinase [Teredinibacter sp. KSP-S5-2]|uniref:(d)CMP kinase n=1 Tax=Teredinibacter sp. KSP-S5-2 TaxID=3034506 RepID=UPI00293513F6|nr:(d)CMP kinase [Teredinibacter sp. KSP-S5-2]WNO11726.1 (d)CMP kinase [Teredinibacter sp. KSP-S5-2]
MHPVITIDGPSGAGKGTIARLVAERTGFHILDSGSLYRLTGLAALGAGVDLGNEVEVAVIAANLDVEFIIQQQELVILLGGEDVTQAIRQERIGMAASKVAAHNSVRDALLERQRAFAMAQGLVADGRDMGTVVFPNAQVKVFLTATAAERAKRRVLQLEESGAKDVDYKKILSDIEQRDYQDANRAVAPLKPAVDAVTIDSTELSIEQVCQQIMALANRAFDSSSVRG